MQRTNQASNGVMNARELMIGNLMFHNGEIEEFDSFLAWHLHELKPIPLTEEWLLKFGFVLDENCYQNTIALYPGSSGFNYNGNFFEYDNLINIEYVHQLQNLYFALTGQDLTLNDKL